MKHKMELMVLSKNDVNIYKSIKNITFENNKYPFKYILHYINKDEDFIRIVFEVDIPEYIFDKICKFDIRSISISKKNNKGFIAELEYNKKFAELAHSEEHPPCKRKVPRA